MRTKRTSEGWIFHCSGDQEKKMAGEMIRAMDPHTELSLELARRYAEGNNEVFYVLENEKGEFLSLLAGAVAADSTLFCPCAEAVEKQILEAER